jgi:hypothetical protein
VFGRVDVGRAVLRETYELESHAARFDAANGDVEEAPGALCGSSVLCAYDGMRQSFIKLGELGRLLLSAIMIQSQGVVRYVWACAFCGG